MKKNVEKLVLIISAMIVAIAPARAQIRWNLVDFNVGYSWMLNNYGELARFGLSGPGSFLRDSVQWGGRFSFGSWHKTAEQYVVLYSGEVFVGFDLLTPADWIALRMSPYLAFTRNDTAKGIGALYRGAAGLELSLASRLQENIEATLGGRVGVLLGGKDILSGVPPNSIEFRISFASPWKALSRGELAPRQQSPLPDITPEPSRDVATRVADSIRFADAMAHRDIVWRRTVDSLVAIKNSMASRIEREQRKLDSLITVNDSVAFRQVFNARDTSADSPIILDDDSFDANRRLRSSRLNDLVAILVSNTEYYWKLEYGETYSENQMMRLIDEIVGQIPDLKNKILLSTKASRGIAARFICLGRFSLQ